MAAQKNKTKNSLKNKTSTEEISFENIFEQSPVGLLLYDKKGFFLKANRTSLQILGIKSTHIFKKYSLFHIPFFPRISRSSLKKEKVLFFETSYRKGRSSSRGSAAKTSFLHIDIISILDSSQAIMCYLINIQDITPLKNNQKMLEESERTLHTILSASPVGICLVNGKRKLGWANDFLLNMIGYINNDEIFTEQQGKPDKPGGLSVKEIFPPMCGHELWQDNSDHVIALPLIPDLVQVFEQWSCHGAVGGIECN